MSADGDICNHSTLEVEAGGSQIQGQPGPVQKKTLQNSPTVNQATNQNKTNNP
jgi:hypothetical protein